MMNNHAKGGVNTERNRDNNKSFGFPQLYRQKCAAERDCSGHWYTAKGIAEISRVLKEGGIFYNAVILKENLDKFFYTKNGFRKFTKEEYIALGKKAGFRRIRIKKLGNDYGLLIIYMK